MLWLGGGYPELHARALAANTPMLEHLRAAHQRVWQFTRNAVG
ncbi:cobyrinic acid a,c-diamide synthase [Kluyvera cryocrescens]|uniref:Cobyrinic acid a,c-diamide synthase n=1 Tax=Kluyvera cryocrescens TaxID=580 RepID=A0A485ANR0_KLUCR|nr:cobyrinic acid a,c-diamide synthase [Kluyvera cryocrescens]